MMVACAPVYCAPETKAGKPMNAHLQLYQFTHDGDSISVARVTHLRIRPGPQAGQEIVSVDLELTERLWGDGAVSPLHYAFQRPSNEVAQLKFPDPVWGRVDLREGAQVLLVTPPPPAGQASNPIYVDGIEKPDDPVLKSIRAMLEAERAGQDRTAAFERRLRWLTAGNAVQKLFAGETLATEGAVLPQQEAQLILGFTRSFGAEPDEYVKISLGSLLWDRLYERVDEAGRVQILNAAIEAAGSPSESVRSYALDRLAETDPALLRQPGIRPTPEVVRLLEDRRAHETDAGMRHQLDQIINSLRR